MADLFGRRPVILSTLTPFTVPALASAAALSVGWSIAWRVASGPGPAGWRGRFVIVAAAGVILVAVGPRTVARLPPRSAPPPARAVVLGYVSPLHARRARRTSRSTCVNQAVWRFVTVPGIFEVLLERQLRAIPGVECRCGRSGMPTTCGSPRTLATKTRASRTCPGTAGIVTLWRNPAAGIKDTDPPRPAPAGPRLKIYQLA